MIFVDSDGSVLLTDDLNPARAQKLPPGTKDAAIQSAAAAFFGPPVVPRAELPKSLVQERVNLTGKLGTVLQILNSQPIYFARWFAPDWPNVYADDPGLLQILGAAGLTAAEIAMVVAP
jgi:hypothetical protein